jgi:hypothetical protein
MAGYYLAEGKENALAGSPLTDFAAANFAQQADPHYTYLWSHCSESEKIALLMILTLGMQKPSRKSSPTAENLARLRPRAAQDLVSLAKRGLVEESEGLYVLGSASFEAWIRREVVAAPGEEEPQSTAEEWLRSGGRDDLRASKDLLPRFKKRYWGLLAEITKELSFEFAAAGALELIKVLV